MPFKTQEIHIDDSGAGNLGTSLAVTNLEWPSVTLSNGALRWIYAPVDILDANGNTIGRMNYAGAPPSAFYRLTSLISGHPALSAYSALPALISQTMGTVNEELPLPMPFSKFRIGVVGPAWNNSVPFSQYLEGRLPSWAMTVMLVWLSAIASGLSSWKTYEGEAPAPSPLASQDPDDPGISLSTISGKIPSGAAIQFVLGRIEGIIEAVLGEPPTVATPQISKSLWQLLADPAIQNSIAGFFHLAPGQIFSAALQVFPASAWISRFFAMLNVVLLDLEFFSLNESGSYVVDIPVRRAPQLTAAAVVNVAAGARAAWDVELVLPDGFRLSLFQHPFQAVVSALPQTADTQGFLFENITVYRHGGYETLPLSITLSVTSADTIGWINPSALNVLPPDGAYDFPYGIGPFVQGLQQGSGALGASLALDPGSYPDAIGFDRDAFTTASLQVTDAELTVAFSPHWMRARTGTPLPLPLSISYAFNPSFTGETPVTANVELNDDATQATFTGITLDDGTVLPYTIVLESEGSNATGDPLIDFMPSPQVFYGMLGGAVALLDGISGLVRVRDKGRAKITAVVILDPDQPSATGPVSDTIEVEVELGTASASLRPDHVDFDDDLVQTVAAAVYLPDNTHWSTGRPITADASIADDGTTQTLYLANVWYEAADGTPVQSIADLQFTLPSGGAVEFDSNDAFGTASTAVTMHGKLERFLTACQAGRVNLNVTPVKADSSPINFTCEPATPAVLDVANPAVPMLTEYYEIDKDGNRFGPNPCADGGSCQIWRADTVEIHGSVSSYTPKTTLRVYLNNADQGAVQIENDGSFSASVTGLAVGPNTIRFDADKPANFGHPKSASVTFDGLAPTVTLLSPLPSTTFDNVFAHVTGTYATAYGFWTWVGTAHHSGQGIGRKTTPGGDGSFDDPQMPVPLESGDTCYVYLQVANGLTNAPDQLVATITCQLPDVSFAIDSSLVVASDPPQQVDVFKTPVLLHGGVTQIPSGNPATIEVAPPGGSFQRLGEYSVPFSLNLDVPEEGTYKVRVSAQNPYGEASLEADVVQSRLIAKWDIYYTASIVENDSLPDGVTQAVRVFQQDDNGTWASAYDTSVTGHMQVTWVQGESKSVAFDIDLYYLDAQNNPTVVQHGIIDLQGSGNVVFTSGNNSTTVPVCCVFEAQYVDSIVTPVPPPVNGYPSGPNGTLMDYFFEGQVTTGWTQGVSGFGLVPQ